MERGSKPFSPEEKGKKTQSLRAEQNAVYMYADLKDAAEQGLISVLSIPAIKKARMILAESLSPYTHDDVRGIWFYGQPRTGKSRAAFAQWPDAYRKAQNKWFDGYSGQESILLDDLDSDVLGHHLKLWADRYPVQGETKFGHVQLVHKVFVVTSNYSPEDLFKCPIMAAAIRARFQFTHFSIGPFNSSIHVTGDNVVV